MRTSSKRNTNGRAFEYAIAAGFHAFLCGRGLNVRLVGDNRMCAARDCYHSLAEAQRRGFDSAAHNIMPTLLRLEPGLCNQKDDDDTLEILLNGDEAGERGDVRDVVFRRADWGTGISAKNNNDSMKHSRLGWHLDFGKSWLGIPCTSAYWDEVAPVFATLGRYATAGAAWSDIADKEARIYVPLLRAFRAELLRINESGAGVPVRLVTYLIGRMPFYKVIKDDVHNMVVVKAFNIGGGLNKAYGGVSTRYTTCKAALPTRIVELDFKPGSATTLQLVADNGWEMSFRIHNARTLVERSLKFDIKLLGNPPVLFTQHIFQEEA